MRQRLMTRHGQSILEYAVLVSAVAIGVAAVTSIAYKAFTSQAQQVEQQVMVF